MFKMHASGKGQRRKSSTRWLVDSLESRLFLTFYSITDLGTLGGSSSYGFDINSSNEVVGYAQLATGANRAFLFKDANNNGIADSGEMVNLGTLAGYAASYAYAINNDGAIVGTSVTAASARKAVRFQTTGAPTDLAMGVGSSAYDVNINGEIVGASLAGQSYVAAYRSPTGQVTQLGTLSSDVFARSEAFAINDSGTIAGYSSTDAGDSAFVRPSGGSMTAIGFPNQPFYYEYGYAWGINAAGQIVGEGFNSDAQYHGFRYDGGTVSDLGIPNGFTTSQALAINNNGEIVGQGKNSAGQARAVLFSGDVAYDLNSLIPVNSGWTLTRAASINDNGYIVGEGISPSGQTHAFLLTPATNVLTISGDLDMPDEDDTIILRQSSVDPSLAEVFINNDTTIPTSTFVVSDYIHVFVNGGGGNDRVVLDFSAGGPIPGGGVSVDGQSGSGDSLQIIGTPSADNIGIGASNIALGAYGGHFSNIEGMEVDGGGGDDTFFLNATLPFSPAFSGGDGSDTLTINGGTHMLSTDAGISSLENISVQNSAILNLDASQHLWGFLVGGKARVNLLAQGSRFIRVNDLTVASGATVDLFDNDLIIENASVDTVLAMVNALVSSARNATTRWGGTGLTSSAAASNSITGLAAVINNDGSGSPIRSDLLGETLNTNMVLVVYTYDGDVDVNGTINADDYAVIDQGYIQQLTGYRWGDVNYSGGAINSDDYFSVDRAFSVQVETLAIGIQPQAASSDAMGASTLVDPVALPVLRSSRRGKSGRQHHFPKNRIPSNTGSAVSAIWDDLHQKSEAVAGRFWVATLRPTRRLFRLKSLHFRS
ncbi:MAG TPA: DUF3466 family protein [Tepidisphaeraceae bacterium]|nr:DUF3466 family protein [Tepidisphaeraceae bacterium]